MISARRPIALLCILCAALLLPALASQAAHHEADEKPSGAGLSMQQMIEQQLGQIPSTDEVIDQLTKDLTLTETQSEKIRPIVDGMSAQMKALVEKFKAGELAAMGLVMQLQNLGNKAAKQIETHLEASQIEKYTKLRLAQRQAMMKQFMQAQSAGKTAK